jgi:hypothetical protein
MQPFSHLVLASNLEARLAPASLPDYYWGAVAPDIRYIAGMRRSQTHLPARTLLDLIPTYPHLQSFIQGYLVHCLTDEIDLERIFFSRLPLAILKNQLSRRQIAVLLELFFVETVSIEVPISGSCNTFLRALGIQTSDCEVFARGLRQYRDPDAMDTRIQGLLQASGLRDDRRIQRYLGAAERFQKQWLLRHGLFLAMRISRINEALTFQVSSRLTIVGTSGVTG